MVDNTNFILKNMDDYISRKEQYAFQNNRGYQKVKFNTNAILALFDKNNDSVISKREFDSISEADFEKYKQCLNEYRDDDHKMNITPADTTSEPTTDTQKFEFPEGTKTLSLYNKEAKQRSLLYSLTIEYK